jgi:glutathione peroxidase
MKQLFFLMLLLCGFGLTSKAQTGGIYSSWFKASNGTDTIRLSNYTGKKILIVNIASMNSNLQQVQSLQQLYNQYQDSGLVVIAVPSNSFYNEPGSDGEIGQLLRNRFNISFLLTSK